MKETNSYNGLRCLGFGRSSSDPQAHDGAEQQRHALQASCQERGMIWVGFEHETVSGSDPGDRSDIDRLLERKRTVNDYDVLLLWDRARLTRAGQKHAAWLEVEFGRHGVRVLSMSSKSTGSRWDWVPDGIEDEAAFDYVLKLSRNKTRGRQAKLESGLIPYTVTPPFGIDRLYLTPDNQPICIIRNMRDGTQQRLHPETREVLQTYPKERRGEEKRHFRKQRSDKLMLVPGSDEDIEVVRYIMHAYYVLGLGARRIALHLRDKGIKSPWNRQWRTKMIFSILHNDIYTGRGVANRWASGKFFISDHNEPKEVEYDLFQMMAQKKRKPRLRPPEEWVIKEYPSLKSILDQPLRDEVGKRQWEYWVNRATGVTPIVNRDKHRNSSFFLKHFLRCKETGYGLVGKTGSRDYRYYCNAEFVMHPDEARPWLSKVIAARPVEDATKAVLTEVFAGSDFTSEIRRIVEDEVGRIDRTHTEISSCETRKADVDNQIKFALSQLADLGSEAVTSLTAPLKEERRVLETQLAKLRAIHSRGRINVDEKVKEITADMQALGTVIDGTEPHLLKNVLSTFATMQFDMEKREIDFNVMLPSWAVNGDKRIRDAIGFVTQPTCREGHEAKYPLVSYKCLINREKQGRYNRSCVRCTRRPNPHLISADPPLAEAA